MLRVVVSMAVMLLVSNLVTADSTVCHVPRGNPDKTHTIVVDEWAVPDHIAHGDSLGACPEDCGGVPSPVAKTGQTRCWDYCIGGCFPFPGEDVLVYETDCLGGGQDGGSQLGASAEPRFSDNADGTATDNLTGLIWLRQASCFGSRTFHGAIGSVRNLADGSCGLRDHSVAGEWRVPNVKELLSLIDYGRNAPWGDGLPAGHPFDQPGYDYYWTSTTQLAFFDDNGGVMIVNPAYGWAFQSPFANDYPFGAEEVVHLVWPVRGWIAGFLHRRGKCDSRRPQNRGGVMYKITILVVSVLSSVSLVLGAPGAGKVTLCHCPWSNPDGCMSITVGPPAAATHLNNHPDDLEGVCAPTLVWETIVPGWGARQATIAAHGQSLALLAQGDEVGPFPFIPERAVIALNAQNGEQEWLAVPFNGTAISLGENPDTVFAVTTAVWDDNPFGECVLLFPSMLYGYDVETGAEVVAQDSVEYPAQIVQKGDSAFVVGQTLDPCAALPGPGQFLVTAHSADDGAALWSHGLGETPSRAMAVTADESGMTVFATGLSLVEECRTYAYDSASGSILWSASSSACDYPLTVFGPSRLAFSALTHQVFLKANGEDSDGNPAMTIVAYDSYTGVEMWQSSLSGYSRNDFVVSTNGEVVAVAGPTTVALDASDGAILWSDDSIDVYDIIASGAVVILTGQDDTGSGVTVARRPESGSTVWTAPSDKVAGMVMADEVNARFYTVGSAPGGMFVNAYALPAIP